MVSTWSFNNLSWVLGTSGNDFKNDSFEFDWMVWLPNGIWPKYLNSICLSLSTRWSWLCSVSCTKVWEEFMYFVWIFSCRPFRISCSFGASFSLSELISMVFGLTFSSMKITESESESSSSSSDIVIMPKYQID